MVAMAQTGRVLEAVGEAHRRTTCSTSGPLRPWTHQLPKAASAVDMLGGIWKRSHLETLALVRDDIF